MSVLSPLTGAFIGPLGHSGVAVGSPSPGYPPDPNEPRLLDEDGNPLLDEDGNELLEE